jgi:hypothetical protein
MAISKGRPISWAAIVSDLHTYYPEFSSFLPPGQGFDSPDVTGRQPRFTPSIPLRNQTFAAALSMLSPPNIIVRPPTLSGLPLRTSGSPLEGIRFETIWQEQQMIAPDTFVAFTSSVHTLPGFGSLTEVTNLADSYVISHPNIKWLCRLTSFYSDGIFPWLSGSDQAMAQLCGRAIPP